MFHFRCSFQWILSIVLLLARVFSVHAYPGEVLQQLLTPSEDDLDSAINTTLAQKPFYVIAHRVLTIGGVVDAISHGANAIEMDMRSFNDGWWADHDGVAGSAGDTARDMFNRIRSLRQEGRVITFVWLDIKNPNRCDPDDAKWRHCSIAGLRDLAREILQPVGVRVLFGFYDSNGKAYSIMRHSYNSNEALNINGKWTEVRDQFQKDGPTDIARRIMSYGYYKLRFEFGNCAENRYYTCTELRQGVSSGQFGKVFGWSSAQGQEWYVDKLLDVAGIDGLIYGFQTVAYYDHYDTRMAARDILQWIEKHPQRLRWAQQDDNPW